jgi:hypothetical protein
MFCSALLLAAASGAAAEYPNLRRIAVGSPACREIVVIGNVQGPAGRDLLALADAAGNLVVPELGNELAVIDQALVSPAKDLLLSVSVGEGHQAVTLYRLAELAGGTPMSRVDPYPYSWSNIRWAGAGIVRFRAAGDYLRLDPATRRPAARPALDDGEGEWEWRVAADRFRPAGG